MTAPVGVVHLASGSLGVEPFTAFVASYRQHDPGVEHELCVVFNGFPLRRRAHPFLDALGDVPHRAIWTSRRVIDLAAYAMGAEAFAFESLCFLNSNSVVLAPGWLAALHGHGSRTDVGAVGSTGTWESHLTGARTPVVARGPGRRANARRAVADTVRAARRPMYERSFAPFPNPHLRTNAFLIRRERFLSLRWGRPRTKAQAHQLESGRAGWSRQLEAGGLRCLVVGRDGRAFLSPDWPASRTFRAGEQENLLIADNRTRQYADADPGQRRLLAQLAWGD